MRRRTNGWPAIVVAILLATTPDLAAAAAGPALPAGLRLAATDEGLTLATADGAAVYRLDLDRIARRRPQAGDLTKGRCSGVCDQIWRPVMAPSGYKPEGDWSVTARASGVQLTYKGDALYTFVGKSFDDAAVQRVVPPYFTSYTGKPAAIIDGVPVATIYWHAALYQPPAPKVVTPAGVTTRWAKAAYVFSAGDKRSLYTRKNRQACAKDCDGLAPFAAPLAALPVGDWRPTQGPDGARVWAYRGQAVYAPTTTGEEQPAGANWRLLEVR